jgi:TPR repeat protein
LKGDTEQMVEYLKKSIGLNKNGIRTYEQVIKPGIKLGEYYSLNDDYDSMDQICKIITSYNSANTHVANLYQKYWENKSRLSNSDLETMEKVGEYYKSIGNFNLMKKYWLSGVELGSTECMELLADYYHNTCQIDRAIKWWLKAVEKKSIKSMEALGSYYKSNGLEEQMALFYTQAMESGSKKPQIIADLANYYESISSDELAYKYYLML